MKLLTTLMCAMLVACNSSGGKDVKAPRNPDDYSIESPWKKTNDPEALAARDMMASAVRISVDVTMEEQEDQSLLMSVQKGSEEKMSWTGSGFVVEVDRKMGKGRSLIGTAGHVCHVPDVIETLSFDFTGSMITLKRTKYKVTSKTYTVHTLDGRQLRSDVLYFSYDEENHEVPDVCTMVSYGLAGRPVQIADELPPEGAVVQNVGYPLGIQQDWMVHVSDARFGGIGDGRHGFVYTSTPGIGGLSGSPIFYRGKVFAVLVAGYGYEHLTLSTPLVDLNKAIVEGKKKWLNP